MSTITKIYTKYLHSYPILIQSIQTGLLMGTGDLVAQTLIEKQSISKINAERTLKFISLGALFVGPAVTSWYRILSFTIGGSDNKTITTTTKKKPDIKVVIQKVALDQILFAPLCLASFLTAINFLDGRKFSDTKNDMREKFPDMLITNYKVWPLIQLGNFYFVPLNYQTLLVQTVAIFWNAYLSWKTHTKSDSF